MHAAVEERAATECKSTPKESRTRESVCWLLLIWTL